MYASGSKTKNVIPKSAMAGKASRTVRAPRASASAAAANSATGGGAGGSGAGGNSTGTPNTRSKFTERKQLAPMRTRSLRLDHSANGHGGSSNRSQAPVAPTISEKKRGVTIMSPPHATAARARVWNRKEGKQNTESNSKAGEKIEGPLFLEVGIQTNEPEILNHDLLVGDIKLMMPSKLLVVEIDRQREEMRKRQLLKAQRKFEGHAEKQEEHLTDLKEFLEKAVVTKRNRKPKLTLELDKKLIHSMDEILNREVPKTESITDIKGRIKKKEQELLNLFDNVERLQIYSKN